MGYSIIQGQVTGAQATSTVPDVSLISLADLQGSGGQLQITDKQAQALKEVFRSKLQESAVKEEIQQQENVSSMQSSAANFQQGNSTNFTNTGIHSNISNFQQVMSESQGNMSVMNPISVAPNLNPNPNFYQSGISPTNVNFPVQGFSQIPSSTNQLSTDYNQANNSNVNRSPTNLNQAPNYLNQSQNAKQISPNQAATYLNQSQNAKQMSPNFHPGAQAHHSPGSNIVSSSESLLQYCNCTE